MERRLLTLLCWALSPAVLAQTVSTAPDLEIIPDAHDYVYVDQAPVCLNLEEIKLVIGYPLMALKEKIEGRVYCRILIDEQGRYLRHVVLRSDAVPLASAVESHIHLLQFSPALRAGSPLKYWVNQYFEFKADGNARLNVMRKDNTTFLRRSMGQNREEGLRLLQVGLGLLAEQQYQSAADYLENAIRLLPRNRRFRKTHAATLFRAHLYAARAELALNNPEKATHHLTEAIGKGLTPRQQRDDWNLSLMQAHLLRAEAFLAMNQPLRALDDANWVEANEEPLTAPALVLISRIHGELGDFEQALTYAARSLEQFPNFAQGYLQKAELLIKLGGKEAACDIVAEASPFCRTEADRLWWLELSLQSCPESTTLTKTQ